MFRGRTVLFLGKENLVAGKKKGKRKEIRRYPVSLFSEVSPFRLEFNPQQLKEILKEVERQMGPLRRVALLLPENSFFINFINLPQIPDSTLERQRMLYFYMKKRFQGRGEVAVAYHHHGEGRFVVATTGRDGLDALKEFFQENRVKLSSIKPASISALNYFLSHEAPENFSFIFPVDGFVVVMGGRGKLEVYRRIRPPYGEEEVLQELESIDRFLGVNTQKISCKDSLALEEVQEMDQPCWKLPVLGEME